MENESNGHDVVPFSYDILDQEASKISSLIQDIQKKCAVAGDQLAVDLFGWAQECDNAGRLPEAEFLYLHFINVFVRQYNPEYPIIFRGLREFARQLLDQTVSPLKKTMAESAGQNSLLDYESSKQSFKNAA